MQNLDVENNARRIRGEVLPNPARQPQRNVARAVRAQVTRWCFTINNYTEEHCERILSIPRDPRGVRYIVVGREVGASGTPHLQGYIEFSRSVRMATVQMAIGARGCHVEAAIGTAIQNKEYCTKENNVLIDWGSTGNERQGTRNDIRRVKELLDGGGSLRDVADMDFNAFCKYHRALGVYSQLRRAEPRNFRTQCVWIWGPTGSGKSMRANSESLALSGGDVAWIADPTLQWFEPYAGNKGVVLDDFDGRAPIALLLRLLDRYPMLVSIKGQFVNFCARIVWITSNFSPSELYGNERQFDALRRRIDEVIHIE